VIILWKRLKYSIRDKLIFFAPVISVILLASVLVYITYLANFTITAAVIEEEGSGSEAASAGLVNALTFILPAIIGGFGIMLLFKYRKKLELKFFFGGALFFAGTFITFFFGDSILYLLQTRFFDLFIFKYDPYFIKLSEIPPVIAFDGIYLVMIICCGILSFLVTYVISSKKFLRKTKNSALIVQSALMGAFLSVILPTFTVVILLIGLSLYDIYSVRRGPIKDIVTYSMEDEANKYRSYNSIPQDSQNQTIHQIHAKSSKPLFFTAAKDNGSDHNPAKNAELKPQQPNQHQIQAPVQYTHEEQDQLPTQDQGPEPLQIHPTPINLPVASTTTAETDFNQDSDVKPNAHKVSKIVTYSVPNNEDEADSILTSMTYSSKDWDIGIGDLVFYSLLASQPLTPYFIFNHGGQLLETYGLWIFWLISLFTVIGILIGFIITIRLLERNSMLPGLPLSIALGLAGFLGSTFVISLI
jgi:hypothetical protein